MATIDSREAIDKIIAANGAQYPDEPPITKIIEYTNAWGGKAYGVVFEDEPADPYRYEVETPYVRRPRVIWRRTSSTKSNGAGG